MAQVNVQVEVVEKNAEARLKALDELAQEMGNRKITLNFDEASLQRWKAATDKMSAAQINAYARIVTAVESTTQAEINAANRVQTEVVKAEAKKATETEKTTREQIKAEKQLTIERQKSFDKKYELMEKEDTKRQEIASKERISNNELLQSQKETADATRDHAAAENELGSAASKTSGVFDTLTSRFTAANLVSTAITFAISKLRQAIRQAVDEMKEMDKELTTIKMVTGASDYDISKLTEQAFAGARANGRSVNDYLTAAERFARAGYRDNIDQLSKLSLMTQNIGGVEEDTAAKFLLAADAAWKLNGSYDALMGVLDGVSAVADQNATDLGKIAEGITVAGSAFANAGESATVIPSAIFPRSVAF